MKRRIGAVLLGLCVVLSGCSIPAWSSGAGEPETQQLSPSKERAKETQHMPEPVEKEPVVQNVTITAVGDCTLGSTQKQGYSMSFHDYYDRYGENYFLDGVRELFEKDDFTLVNLECVLSDSNDRVEKTYNLKGKPGYVGILTGSSVEGCSLGNNHTFDYGQQGLDDTRNVLDKENIIFGFNEHTSTFRTKFGLVVGLVSACQLSADEKHADYIRDGIKELKGNGADIVIACCHWGIEGDHYPNDYQQKLAHQVIDWGADVLIGTHPHVLQGVELYKGKVICYSLGNFCFGGNRNPSDKDTAVFSQTFTFVDGKMQDNISARMIPFSISSTTQRNDFRPEKTEGERKKEIISHMNEYSKPYSNAAFDKDGTLIIREPDK